jgi:hypothetical protein
MEKFKYGLVVFDPEQEGEEIEILHFIGYYHQPTEEDFNRLRQALLNESVFDTQDIAERLEIVEAPEHVVELFNQNNHQE